MPVADEVKIQVKDGVLTVSGQRKSEHNEESEKNGVKFRRVERSSGSFTRSIAVPREVDQEKITASQDNGVLRITLPKVCFSLLRLRPASRFARADCGQGGRTQNDCGADERFALGSCYSCVRHSYHGHSR